MLVQRRPPAVSKTRGQSSDPATWHPVANQVTVPTSGVTVREGGLFHTAMVQNIQYLLDSFSVDHMLYHFRLRAGQKDAPGGSDQVEFWDTYLEGANAGRFLMGAGNTLRWIDHAGLRKTMDDVVNGIAACQRDDGYVYPFPSDERFIEGEPGTPWCWAQRSSYSRVWVNYGLLDAAMAGSPRALGLARSGHDWFNHCTHLPRIPSVILWSPGHLASTRMYFSPLGKPEDLQVAESAYIVDGWVDDLVARDPDAIWKRGLDYPHSYELAPMKALLDHYRATGEARYLRAAQGAYDMMHRLWMHPGRSVALCEGIDYPPSSFFVDPKKHTGEFCGSVFWAKFCQRFHQLYPDQEQYVSGIEQAIYNVGLANLVAGQGIRYHACLEGQNDRPQMTNTCCEGQGTRFIGSLPEYIYSLAEDGLLVNLFEASRVDFACLGHRFTVTLESRFPFGSEVTLRVGAPEGGRMRLRIRVPSWINAPMPVEVNGKRAADGEPGTHVILERDWLDGDAVEFQLPMGLRISRYRGADNLQYHHRF